MSKTTTFASGFDCAGKPAKPGDDLVLVFSGFTLCMEFLDYDDGFDERKAAQELEDMAREIWIDKTYVNFEGTKYKNVFLKEEGWNELMSFIWKTKRARSETDHLVLRKAFESMIVAYMEHVAYLLGYEPGQIEFWVHPDSNIEMRMYKDVAKEWQRYPGQWQDWPENN